VITLLMVWMTWERYGAFWSTVAVVLGLALAALTALVSWATNANLQADMDGGIKRLAVATVAKVTHDGEQSRYRIELRTEETPPCSLEFDCTRRGETRSSSSADLSCLRWHRWPLPSPPTSFWHQHRTSAKDGTPEASLPR